MIDMDVYPKFIIEGDRLILSKVTYHKELVTDKSKVKGGGWFRYLHHTDTFVLTGSSFDFGAAQFADIKRCIKSGNVFSDKDSDHDISKDHHFSYDTGTEVIEIKTEESL
jgi:hypothetical protein